MLVAHAALQRIDSWVGEKSEEGDSMPLASRPRALAITTLSGGQS
jgi:hypothetical protein